MSLTENFEGHALQADGGVEFWLARDLQHLLGYSEEHITNNKAVRNTLLERAFIPNFYRWRRVLERSSGAPPSEVRKASEIQVIIDNICLKSHYDDSY